MTLTPQDIEAQVFREKFKGYDQDEVDAFLDRVSDQLGQLVRERDELTERVRKLESESAESVEDQGLLKRTLLTAQRTADETVAQAKGEAESTTEDADRRAAETLQEAERRAAELVAGATATADQLLADARQESDETHETSRLESERVRTAVADLRRFRSEYRDRVRGVIAEQLALLDRAGDVPDLPVGMTQLAQRLESHAADADGVGPRAGPGPHGPDDLSVHESGDQGVGSQTIDVQEVGAKQTGATEPGGQ